MPRCAYNCASLYLASAGVGKITLVDNDEVDLTNLQRQILHSTASVGQPKAESGKQTLHGMNPTIEVVALVARADAEQLKVLASSADVVLDCTDNFKASAACIVPIIPTKGANTPMTVHCTSSNC